jgi:hypothetical protein
VNGISIVDFWFSDRRLAKKNPKLTPDNITAGCPNRLLPFWLAETVLKRKIEGSTFVYVQERLVLPSEIAIDTLRRQCAEHALPVQKVFLVPDLQEDRIVGLVVVESTPKALVELVYRTMCVLSESIFKIEDDPSALLFSYCSAIEYLKSQFEDGALRSSVLQRQVRVKEVTDLCCPVLFRFGHPENRGDSFAAIHAKEIDDLDDLHRALLTTPMDQFGRERSMMVPGEPTKSEGASAPESRGGSPP